MKITRTAAFWFVLGIIYACFTFFLSSISDSGATAFKFLTKHNLDLLFHAVEYGLFTLIILSFLKATGRINQSRLLWIIPILICGLVGAANEVYQIYVPGRFATWSDGIANVSGAALTVLIYQLVYLIRRNFLTKKL